MSQEENRGEAERVLKPQVDQAKQSGSLWRLASDLGGFGGGSLATVF